MFLPKINIKWSKFVFYFDTSNSYSTNVSSLTHVTRDARVITEN